MVPLLTTSTFSTSFSQKFCLVPEIRGVPEILVLLSFQQFPGGQIDRVNIRTQRRSNMSTQTNVRLTKTNCVGLGGLWGSQWTVGVSVDCV